MELTEQTIINVLGKEKEVETITEKRVELTEQSFIVSPVDEKGIKLVVEKTIRFTTTVNYKCSTWR